MDMFFLASKLTINKCSEELKWLFSLGQYGKLLLIYIDNGLKKKKLKHSDLALKLPYLSETRLLMKMFTYILKSNFKLEIFISETNIPIEPKCDVLAEETVVIDSSKLKKILFLSCNLTVATKHFSCIIRTSKSA